MQQGKLDLADPPLTAAAAKLPKNSVIQDHLGDLRQKQNRHADAIAAWQKALAGDGDSLDRAKVQKKIDAANARVMQSQFAVPTAQVQQGQVSLEASGLLWPLLAVAGVVRVVSRRLRPEAARRSRPAPALPFPISPRRTSRPPRPAAA